MKNEEDLVQKVDKFIEKRMNGYAFNIDLEACRLLQRLKEEVERLKKENEKKK